MDRLNFDLTDLRADREDRAGEEARELYARLFLAEQRRQREAWKAEFDTIPFKPNGPAIHQAVVQQLCAMRDQ